MKRRTPWIIALAGGTAAASVMATVAPPATADATASLTLAAPATEKQPATAKPPATTTTRKAVANAVSGAAALVKSRPASLHASSHETFVRRQTLTAGGMHVVAYERKYKGLPVSGGDFVVVTDATGTPTFTSVAQDRRIGTVATAPKLTSAAAVKIAKAQLESVTSVEGSRLVVAAGEGRPAALAWQSTVRGTGKEGPSRLTVDVDALTGKVLRTQEHRTDAAGTGTGWISGKVPLTTTQSGANFSMKDPSIKNLTCQDSETEKTFTGADNVWGGRDGTDPETGCVDAFYVAQRQNAMLASWLGRNGPDGKGGAWPIRVGLDDLNAFYDGTQVQIGRNSAKQWITSADVVGHELGHGIDDQTPGGISGGNTQEFVADTFGAATEWFANNPNDPPDFEVGEEIDLIGNGPIRYMHKPSLGGDDNCYSSSTASAEVHAAAGPGNHWFYLLARGTSGGGDGQPASPTCNNSTITGLGIQKAIKIMYGAMLMKTSSSSYLKYRTWTLTAAKSLFAGSCTEFNTVKAAWDAVSVPAQKGEPTCAAGTPSETPPTTSPTPGPTTSPMPDPTSAPTDTCTPAQLLGNPGFDDGSDSWTATSAVITTGMGRNMPHHGSRFAWLDGYGKTRTDTLSQTVTIPAACTTATLSFYLKISTNETASQAHDKLTLAVDSTTLATYSNIDAGAYAKKSFDLADYAGKSVTITFTGTENASLVTSFGVDSAALDVH